MTWRGQVCRWAGVVSLCVVGVVAGGCRRSHGGIPSGDHRSSPAVAVTPSPVTPTVAVAPAPPVAQPSNGPAYGPAYDPAYGPPYRIEDQTITLQDPGRPTPARGTVPGHPGRVLTTIIRRPAGLPGPLPLVVFGHGWNVNPTTYETLLDAWAAAGYVVAAPTFPDSADTLPGSPVSNYPEQARDISVVITRLLAGGAGPIDPTRIAVAGHSDGGTDIALLALNPAFADPRIRAYLCLSGEIPGGVPGPWGAPASGALLVAVDTHDQYGLQGRATQVFATADVAAKALLTVVGGDHEGIFDGPTAVAAAVRAETVRFLNAALQPQGVSAGALVTAMNPTGNPVITVTVPGGG